MHKTLFYFFTLIVLVFFATDAHALTVSPIRFELKGNPGEVVIDEIALMNETENPVTYYASFANFEAQGETGNPAFVDPTEGLGTWMSVTPYITIAPGVSEVINFKINIPNDAEPGGYFGVVFFGTQPPSDIGQVTIGAKTGILVLLTVNGEVAEAGGITTFNLKENKFFYNTLPVGFEYKFRNDGGDRIKPDGKLTIRNTFYIPTERLPGNPVEGNILPNSTRKFDVNWVENPRPSGYVAPAGFFANFLDEALYQWKNFAFGLYFANLDLAYGKIQASSLNTLHFFVFPWQLLLILFIAFMVVVFGGNKLLKHYNQYIINKANEKTRIGMETPPSVSHDK